ncbi:MAG: hypothetical protein QF619_09120 [Candidatus Binatia bacterium]|nr:hypothetical protein [Candidatus Binatia bacterium]
MRPDREGFHDPRRVEVQVSYQEDIMRFVSFMRKNQACIGLMTNSDQIIDLAEVNRRYLKAGPPSCVADMQSFIESGSKALGVARQAARYVERQNDQGLKRLRQVGVLQDLNRVKLLAPIPWPRKNVILLCVNYL